MKFLTRKGYLIEERGMAYLADPGPETALGRGKRSVTPDTLRLARVTGMSAAFWLGLQQDWDLWHALH